MQTREDFAKTYREAKQNLEDGYVSVGLVKRPQGEHEINIKDKHALIWIVAEYKEGKQVYAYQSTLGKMTKEELDGIKYGLDCLHDIIQDAIRTLPTEELLAVNRQTKWNKYPLGSNSVIACLGEIGAVDLFNLLLEKISHLMSVKDFVLIYKALRESYVGTAESERLGLASSFLHRGDVCFVDMARSVFLRLIYENKLDLFFPKLFKSDFRYNDPMKITIDKAVTFHQNNFMQEWTCEKYIKQSTKSGSEAKVKKYSEQYDRFVVQHNCIDIMGQLTLDYLLPFLIKKGRYQFNQQGVRPLFCISAQALFEQNKDDNQCVVYDSLATNLLLFKRQPNTVSLEEVALSEDQGKDMLAEIKSVEFSVKKKNIY